MHIITPKLKCMTGIINSLLLMEQNLTWSCIRIILTIFVAVLYILKQNNFFK